MSPIRAIFLTVIEALFPTPTAEREVISMGAFEAWKSLPRAKNFPISDACSIFAYKNEMVWRLIWAIKYKKSRPAATIAAHALFRILRTYASVAPSLVIIPMPITRKRRRERGYNQCELILEEIEKLETREPSIGGLDNRMKFVRDLLIRPHHKSRQTLKDRAERIESAEDIFMVDKKVLERFGQPTKDSLVIIIDDVVTTGSSIRNAVQTLRRVGFANVFGLSVAH